MTTTKTTMKCTPTQRICSRTEHSTKELQNKTTRAFSLVELLIVVVAISLFTTWGLVEYREGIERAKRTRAAADIDELIKAIKLHNVQENKHFAIATFTIDELTTFVGNYLDREPPNDPWGNSYLHSLNLGIVYSKGPDGIDQTTQVSTFTDDIALNYLPMNFFITKAEYVDQNRNNMIDSGDYLKLTFSRPAMIDNIADKPIIMQFDTDGPPQALGDAIIKQGIDEFSANLHFLPNVRPKIILGKTRLFPTEYNSITDYSPFPKKLERFNGVLIEKSK